MSALLFGGNLNRSWLNAALLTFQESERPAIPLIVFKRCRSSSRRRVLHRALESSKMSTLSGDSVSGSPEASRCARSAQSTTPTA